MRWKSIPNERERLIRARTAGEYFQATALHQKIRAVEVGASELLEGISENQLIEKLSGRAFQSAHRYGKYLFAEVEGGGWLVLHFGITGFLKYFKADQAPAHCRLLVEFTNGYRLAYISQRKLGRIGWTIDRDHLIKETKLGSDPLLDEFDEDAFQRILERRRGSIKGLLMNQHLIAGIGNIYSDEILFHAGVHPQRNVSDLKEKERRQIYRYVKEVLHTAIRRRTGEKGWPHDWLLPQRKPGRECPRCGSKILRLKVSGRSAYYCKGHQK